MHALLCAIDAAVDAARRRVVVVVVVVRPVAVVCIVSIMCLYTQTRCIRGLWLYAAHSIDVTARCMRQRVDDRAISHLTAAAAVAVVAAASRDVFRRGWHEASSNTLRLCERRSRSMSVQLKRAVSIMRAACVIDAMQPAIERRRRSHSNNLCVCVSV